MIIIIGSLILFLLLFVGFDINISDFYKLKKFSEDNVLCTITNKLPENRDVCTEILEILDNKKVSIDENKSTKTSLFLITKNKILLGNLDKNFTRIQTIAHECIHSTQNRKTLITNYCYSNFYLLYYFTICMLSFFRILTNQQIKLYLIIRVDYIKFVQYIY